MKHLIFILFLIFPIAGWSQQVQAVVPVPQDFRGTPIQNPLGLPIMPSPTPTLTGTAYVDVMTLPTTGDNTNRQFRSICLWNPSSVDLYVCFGASCSTDMIKLRGSSSGAGLCMDNTYFGPLNSTPITKIRARLGSASTVSPDVVVW